MTKQDLQQLYWTKKNIEALEDKLKELRTEATKITTHLSNQPKATTEGDKLSTIVAKIIDIQKTINLELQLYYHSMEQIEKAIRSLPEREAYLIRLRYINCKNWESICVEMNYSWRQIHYIHSDALKLLSA